MTATMPPWTTASHIRRSPERPLPADDIRDQRQRLLVVAYRLFGAMGWGTLGDGHISARDPERTEAFWLLRYGVAFNRARIDDLVLVGPGGEILAGGGAINMTAYHIHGPIHDARPEVVSVAHTHTAYGTPWAANALPFRMICQEATAFFEDHAVYQGEEVQVMDVEDGRRIASALGDRKAIILRNHGPVTVGASIEEAIGWFLTMERVAEVHVKAQRPRPISDAAARLASTEIGAVESALSVFEYAVASKLDLDSLSEVDPGLEANIS